MTTAARIRVDETLVRLGHPGDMVVMQILPDLKVGGAQTSVVSLCGALVGRDVEVVLVGLGPENELDSEISKHPKLSVFVLGLQRHSIVFFPRFLWSVAKIVRRLAVIMRRHRVDVVQGHLANASLLGGLGAILAGVRKRYGTFHSILFLPRKSRMDIRNRFMLFTLRKIATLFTRYIAVSEAVRTALVDQGIDPDRVVVVPNGVELGDFERIAKDELLRVRSDLGLRDGERAVVCVGTLREAKGHRYLIEAASELAEEFPDVVYLLVGDGSHRAVLEDMTAEFGMRGTVRFLGTRRDISRILSAGSVFVLPSLWEGLPIALLEAMAVGLPCVATRVAGTVEVLQDEESGILVEPGDAHQLAAAIRTVLLDPERALAMGEKGRITVQTRYSMDGMRLRLLELYRS